MSNQANSLLAINFAWVSMEILRHRELLDWGLTIAGSVTLLVLNLIRLWRALKYPQAQSEQRQKKAARVGIERP